MDERNKKDIAVIYFSGTGNTRYCVHVLMQELGVQPEIYSMEEKEAIDAIKRHKNLIFAYPIQYSNLPEIVREFITAHAKLWDGKNIFILATMGAFSGDGAGLSARLFRKYGAAVTGGVHIRMPDSVADVAALTKSEKENGELVRKAEEKLKLTAGRLKQGKVPRDGLSIWHRLVGLFGQRLYFYNKTKKSKDKLKIDRTKCVGCGTCVEHCPKNNLMLREGKAQAKGDCTMCYRCINTCPVQAITLLGDKVIYQGTIEKYISE